ncbi:hypothetical protein DTO027B5_4160 [Paecilomyces variotii]|nr:hypothetical protein DTO027B3_4595 [Paecilomyces variotii]KAJ9334037.1 hypothetical protein DTO027B5_4160 [Paecilomyces variotii]KAJ9410685.1 hypothetical protein DTO045G8_1591 [Paecilomyces variotii]
MLGTSTLGAIVLRHWTLAGISYGSNRGWPRWRLTQYHNNARSKKHQTTKQDTQDPGDEEEKNIAREMDLKDELGHLKSTRSKNNNTPLYAVHRRLTAPCGVVELPIRGCKQRMPGKSLLGATDAIARRLSIKPAPMVACLWGIRITRLLHQTSLILEADTSSGLVSCCPPGVPLSLILSKRIRRVLYATDR